MGNAPIAGVRPKRRAIARFGRRKNGDEYRNTSVLAPPGCAATAIVPAFAASRRRCSAKVNSRFAYRHFPTKGDLVRRSWPTWPPRSPKRSTRPRRGSSRGHSTALEEIFALVHRVVVTMGQERLLREALADGDPARSVPSVQKSAKSALARLVAAAHRDRALRPDVTVDDIGLLLATSPGEEVPRSTRERWVALVRHALTP